MIKTLGHVGLGVSDMEKSLKFYRDFLGMKVIMDLDIADDRIGKVIGVPEAKCRIIHLQLGEMILELFKYTQPKGNNLASKIQQFDHALTHIGFEVDEFHKHIKQLHAKKIEFLGEPVEFRPGVWVAYFRGPDSEIIEFRQQA